MNSKGFLIRTGGFAAALAAHAVFASALLAGQPAADGYLARLAAPVLQAPKTQLAERLPARARSSEEMPTAAHPTRLVRGTIAC